MKKLFYLALLSFSVLISNAAEQLVFTNSNPTGKISNPLMVRYAGNNKLLNFYFTRDTTGIDNSNYWKTSINLLVTDLQGNTSLSTGISVNTSNNYLTLFDGGTCGDGGYFLYCGVNNYDSLYNLYAQKNILVKFNSQGNLLWNTVIIPGPIQYMPGYVKTIQDEAGNFYVNANNATGMSIARINVNGDFAWGRTIGYDSIKNPLLNMELTGDSGILCSGKAESDKMVAIINYDGSVRWAYDYRNTEYTRTYALKKCNMGGYIAGGFTGEGANLFLVRYNADGSVRWDKEYQSGSSFSEVDDIIEMIDGSFLAIGLIGEMHAIIHTDASGNLIGSKIIQPFVYNLYYTYASHLEISIEGNNFVATGTSQSLNGRYNNTNYFFKAHNLNDLCETLDYPLTTQDITSTDTLVADASGLLIRSFTNDNSESLLTSSESIQLSVQNYCSFLLSTSDLTSENSVKLYPNPATESVQVSMPFNEAGIRIFDVQGALVYNTLANNSLSIIDTHNFAPGLYTVHIANQGTDKVVVIKKLVVE